jgi:hydroxymethylglutaryl-CoA reductase
MSTERSAKTREDVLLTASKAYSESSEPSKITIENFVGFVRVPVGLAGPLRVRDAGQTDDDFFAPLATVEPTLVASCSRGCKALQRCGGARFHVLNEGMSRPHLLLLETGRSRAVRGTRAPTAEPVRRRR